MSYEVENRCDCKKKYIYNFDILTFNCGFWPKYESIIHNNAVVKKIHKILPSHIKINHPPFLDLCTFLSWFRKHLFDIKHVWIDLVITNMQLLVLQEVNWWSLFK